MGLKIIKRVKCHHLRLSSSTQQKTPRGKKCASPPLTFSPRRTHADMQPQVIIRIVRKQPARARQPIIHIGLYELIPKAKTNRHHSGLKSVRKLA